MMKIKWRSILALTLLSVFLYGCSKSADQMVVSGNIEGLRKGKVFLERFNDSVFESIDSTVADGDGTFEFSTPLTEPEMHFLRLQFEDSVTMRRRMGFFGETGAINIATTLEQFGDDAQITGSVNQGKLDEYFQLVQQYNDRDLVLLEEGLNALKNSQDSLVADVELRRDRLLRLKYLAAVNFAKNNSNLEVAPYLLVSEVYDVNVTYLDTVYAVLEEPIRQSKYGKMLETLIQTRKDTSSAR